MTDIDHLTILEDDCVTKQTAYQEALYKFKVLQSVDEAEVSRLGRISNAAEMALAEHRALHRNPTPRHTVPEDFVEKILHGDDTHKAWLMEAMVKYNAGLPLPPPRSDDDYDDNVSVTTRSSRVVLITGWVFCASAGVVGSVVVSFLLKGLSCS